jgi:hypothetical protein
MQDVGQTGDRRCTPFELATALGGAASDPVRTGRTSDAYWTFISPFGGVSAAAALRAVLERPEREGDPLALTVNFCAPIAKGRFPGAQPARARQPFQPALAGGVHPGRRRRAGPDRQHRHRGAPRDLGSPRVGAARS